MSENEVKILGMEQLDTKFKQFFAHMLGNPTVSVGFHSDAQAGWPGPRPKGPAGIKSGRRSDNAKGSQQPAAMVAFILNAGAPEKHIPPRPFWDQWKEKYGPTWGDLIKAGLINTGMDSKLALEQAGVLIAAQLQQTIIEFTKPDDSDETKKRKQFVEGNKVLIDSHGMIDSVKSRVQS
jgi:ribosome-associated protein YbcJ (S4-like RNA binding protein)